MKLKNFLGPLLAAALTPATAQPSVQQSHIEANVPSAESFHQVLQRDLSAYFKASTAPSATTSVEYELLRDQPTQSGVSYPKFYAWVTVKNASESLQQGAVRVAAVNRTHFQVTDFLSVAQLKANPGEARLVFPAPLVARILERAGVR